MRPCPWCHDPDYIGLIDAGAGRKMFACDCGLTGPYSRTVQEAQEKWDALPRIDEGFDCPNCGEEIPGDLDAAALRKRRVEALRRTT